MQNIWFLIEKAIGITELHQLAVDAKTDLVAIKLKLDEVMKEGPDYAPAEYPKMVGDKTVYNADEEAALTGFAPVVAVDPDANPDVEDVGYTGSTP